jgi:hypothetical protein
MEMLRDGRLFIDAAREKKEDWGKGSGGVNKVGDWDSTEGSW